MTFKRIHKWVSLFVFAQLFIWLVSGFLLGKVDHKEAAGRDSFVRSMNSSSWLNVPLISLSSIIKDNPHSSEIELIHLLDKPVYRLQIGAGAHAYQASDYVLIDALSGEKIDLSNAVLGPKNSELLSKLARSSYSGLSEFDQPQLMVPPIADLPNERNRVWQVNVRDTKQTSIYIRAQSAEIIGHVNSETRWRDLLLMLHFMDYLQEGSFNNIFIKVFALLTLLLSATGLWWLTRLIHDKQLKLIWFSGKKHLVVHVQRPAEKNITVTGNANSSLLTVLLDNHVNIQAVCGGGGVCGTCKFKSDLNLKVRAADAQHIYDSDIADGYRLACQHKLSEVSEVLVEGG